jgi:UDP-glucose 4-epimerase
VHYPKVVLVTGACRFLGGYLTARLAQNPLINHVIAVDAIAPSKDLLRRMGRAEFVRADIRNPFIAKVIRNGDVDTVVHAAAASYAPRAGGRVALKEQNVMGAMQLFAACQKAPLHAGHPRRASPATASTSRVTRAVWPGDGRTSRCRFCGWPT